MGTQPPDRDDPFEDIDAEELIEEPGLDVREIEDDAFRTLDGGYSDEPYDPAIAPVIEYGGGVAEGFEQSEAELIDHASRAKYESRAPASGRPSAAAAWVSR